MLEKLSTIGVMEITELTPAQIALNQAIDAQGGISAFAKKLNLSGHSVVNQWRINRVPAEHCPSIERLTNGRTRCESLRPDVDWSVLRNQKQSPSRATPAQAAIKAGV
jgi:DNA-binding transcriptional regulator YdaS (Cro superfamily)